MFHRIHMNEYSFVKLMSEEADVKMFQIYSFDHQLQEPNLKIGVMLFSK